MQVTYKEELAPVSFIAGDYQEFEYTLIDIDTGKPIDATTAKEMRFVLFHYGDTETPVLNVVGRTRPMDFGGGGAVFTVCLESDITENLESGLYIQQPIVIDQNGRTFRPCQGTVNVYSRGKEEKALTKVDQ